MVGAHVGTDHSFDLSLLQQRTKSKVIDTWNADSGISSDFDFRKNNAQATTLQRGIHNLFCELPPVVELFS